MPKDDGIDPALQRYTGNVRPASAIIAAVPFLLMIAGLAAGGAFSPEIWRYFPAALSEQFGEYDKSQLAAIYLGILAMLGFCAYAIIDDRRKQPTILSMLRAVSTLLKQTDAVSVNYSLRFERKSIFHQLNPVMDLTFTDAPEGALPLKHNLIHGRSLYGKYAQGAGDLYADPAIADVQALRLANGEVVIISAPIATN